MEIFDLQNLTFRFPDQEQPVLHDISFTVAPGEFVVLAGPSGCGKSTLLRQLKTVLAPHGDLTGQLLFQGKPLAETELAVQTAKIGFVQQSPDNQIVTDKVWHELAFGLESLGYDTPTIRSRVAEMASFFGIQTWFYKNVSELSGGQKQLLNLAAIMAMHPSVLVLDEPTSQLDPIAATDFLSTLGRINRELGTTVLITEHRLEEVFPLCTRVLLMDEGKLLCDGTPEQVGRQLKSQDHGMFLAMPAPMRIWSEVPNDFSCPVTVREGRTWLDDMVQFQPLQPVPEHQNRDFSRQTPAISMEEIWFRYEKDAPDVIKGLSLRAYYGELFCILGGNGTGKSTTLSLLTGVNKPYRGRITMDRDVPFAALPQNPQSLFVKNTVREDLLEMLSGSKLSKEERTARMYGAAELCDITRLLDRHPYDLSGGEQQRAALAKVLLLRPKILLLDEPTKGLDAEFKQTFASIVRGLQASGVCIIMVSHDVEFCAQYADRCALFFDGSIVSEDTPVRFFSGKNFYTTAANRMARHLLPNAVTISDVIVACGGKALPEPPARDADTFFDGTVPEADSSNKQKQPTLPLWRKILAAVSGITALASFVYIISSVNLTDLLTAERMSDVTGNYTGIYAVLLAALAVFALSISQAGAKPVTQPTPLQKHKLSKRTLAAALMIILAIPLTIFIGYRFFGDRKFLIISMLIIVETMLPFVLVFESRKPQARELVVIAVLCAIGIVGRAAFLAVPSFKPVAAIVIIAGVAFGGETGFFVGAMTMFGSNMLFGQGPWTPWQMFAMGMIGFLAGILFRKGVLRRSRFSLCVYGALAIILIYGGLMNPASVLMYQTHPTWEMFFTAYLTGFPVDLMHAAATVLFLWMLSQPMLEKLDRIKVKYGLIEA